MEECKTLEIATNHEITSIDRNLLKQLSRKYSEDDISFEISGSTLYVHLKQLDFSNFKKDVASLTSNGGLYENGNGHHSVVPLILENIEKIKSYGIKGKKRVYVGYNQERKVKNRKQKEQKREIHYYANDNTFSKTNNTVPTEFVNQIFCGDSEHILKQLPDNCIDLMLTSPPYNFGLDYAQTNDDHKWKSYFGKLFAVFSECIRVLKFGGRIIVNTQPLFSDYIPSHHIISNFFMQKKLIWKGEILWEKNNYNCKYTAWGSWKSPSNPYLKYTWEFLEIFTKGTLKKEGRKDDIDITADEFKKWVVAKWSIAPERNMGAYKHPAMFPEELVARVLKLFSFKNDIVLDPFNGVGTTTAVAKKLERKYVGIDVSEEYCDVAKRRIESTLF
jgi:DNA modification methylase